MLHLPRALAHLGAEQQLAAGEQFDLCQFLGRGALVRHRELPDLLDFVSEELDAHRMLVGRGEDVEDAAAHRELAAAGHHVDARVGEVDELRGQAGEVVTAPSRDESYRLEAGQVVGERLQSGAHGGDDDDVGDGGWIIRGILLPALQRAEGADAFAHGFGARTQPLVRQRLPGGEFDHRGLRCDAGQRLSERFGVPTGRHDREQRPRYRSGGEQAGDKGSAKAVADRKISAATGVCEGLVERAGARERRDQALEYHRTSLRIGIWEVPRAHQHRAATRRR